MSGDAAIMRKTHTIIIFAKFLLGIAMAPCRSVGTNIMVLITIPNLTRKRVANVSLRKKVKFV